MTPVFRLKSIESKKERGFCGEGAKATSCKGDRSMVRMTVEGANCPQRAPMTAVGFIGNDAVPMRL